MASPLVEGVARTATDRLHGPRAFCIDAVLPDRRRQHDETRDRLQRPRQHHAAVSGSGGVAAARRGLWRCDDLE